MVFELTGDGAFDGPMAGIVNAGSHFIGKQAAASFEKFDGQHTDVVEGLKNAASGVLRGALDLRLDARGRRERKPENAAAMMISTSG